MMRRIAILLYPLSFSLVSLPATASDAMTETIQMAYAPYRAALFTTNGKSQADARIALSRARSSWDHVAVQFGKHAPVPYANDSKISEDFSSIEASYAKATAEVEQNQLSKAHETLEAIRDILAKLRWRNGVIVFSDYMNDYHTQMENVLRNGASLLAQPNGAMQLMAEVGTLDYLAQRLVQQAPPSLADNHEFKELAQAVMKSVGNLKTALLAGDMSASKEALGLIKKPYAALFLKFG